MLQLLSSFWFVALAGLLVPVLIHLWNKKQPRVIKVGSIKWLTAAASKKANRLIFQDWPLLLWRCLLLAALVMFLVEPVWRQKTQSKPPKLVWVAPELIRAPYIGFIQNTLDSLVKQQYTLRQFTNTFSPITPEDWINLKRNPLPAGNAPRNYPDYWDLAEQVTQKFPAATAHVVFTPDQLSNFAGQRPTLPAKLRWIIIPTVQKKVWVQEAFRSGPDSLTLVLGHSSNTGTSFTRHRFNVTASNQNLSIADGPSIIYTRTETQEYLNIPPSGEKTTVKTDSLRIAIFFDQSRRSDAGYVRAALAALQTYTGRPVSVLSTTRANTIKTDTNRLFWLSDAATTDILTRQLAAGLFIFRDAPALSQNTPARWLSVAGLPAPIPLSRQAPISRPKSRFRNWQNNYGESMLHFVPEGKGGTYYFASRFNNQWNNIPTSGYLPEILSPLLWPEPTAKHDVRSIAETQVEPQQSPNPAIRAAVSFRQVDLKYFFLILAAILFLAERIWAFQKTQVKT